MKSILKFSLFFIVVIFQPHFAYGMTAEEIVHKMNAVLNQETSVGTSKMTIITSSKEERTFVSKSYTKNKGEKNLIRYLEPSRVKDQAFLMLNHADDIWAYFPRTTRVRKLATHAKRQKMEGSDFTYEDMGSGDSFIKEYTSHLLGEEEKEGHSCYKVELVRKPESDAGYSRMILWVIKDTFFPIVSDYYSLKEPDTLEKELIAYDLKEVQGIPTAMKMTMFNKKDLTSTTIETTTIEYNVALDDEMFSERNLRE
jgi:outer membrane lipoprotein-sorting protein